MANILRDPKMSEHRLVNIYDTAVVSVRGHIDDDGNFDTLMNQYEVVSIDGDNHIWCEDCSKEVYVGDGHGLGEYWEVN